MKASRYNVMIPLDTEQSLLAFNCASCGLALLNAETTPQFQSLLTQPDAQSDAAQTKLVEQMQLGTFLIDDSLDEVARLEASHWASRFQTNSLTLTIAPTLACNLRCPYCYEQAVRRNGKMSPETEEQIVAFCQSSSKHLSSLSVVWYGGEPLLARETIFRLSRRFIKMAEQFGGIYKASMVSNGYLLDRPVAIALREHQVELVQITLDGPQAIHDARRPRVGMRGSFDKIVQNLTEIVDVLKVVIRVNVEATNQEAVPALLEVLESRGLKHKVGVYFAQVDAYAASDHAVAKRCFSDQSFSKTEIELYQYAVDNGWQIGKYPHPLTTYCAATRLNAFVVDPWGNLYKCWNTIGEPSKVVGHVSKPVTLNPEHVRWLVTSPFKYEICRNCEVLPICVGGCPYKMLVEEQNGAPRCERWKYNLTEMLRLRYQSSWKQRQGQGTQNSPIPAVPA